MIEAAERFGVSRQAIHRCVSWYRHQGLEGLTDRPSQPRSSPRQTPPEVEAAICELRRNHPRWGGRRIEFELSRNGCLGPVPSRMTVHRVLVRHGLIEVVPRRRRREDYKRWQRGVPMELWQLDVVIGEGLPGSVSVFATSAVTRVQACAPSGSMSRGPGGHAVGPT